MTESPRTLLRPRRVAFGWLLLASAGLGATSPDPDVPFTEPTTALIGVDVLDGSGSPPQRNRTIVISDRRIVAVGATGTLEIPENARRLELRGRTVVPGLVSLHDHTHLPGVPFMGRTASRLWLAGGVTTVQTAGSARPEDEIALARAIEAGREIGPRILPTAPYITGPGGSPAMSRPATEADARNLVRHWVDRGVTAFKLYRHVTPQIAAAVIDEAHRHGVQVTGHLCSLTFAEAARMGIDRIEHGLISVSDFVPDREPGQCVSNRESLTATLPNDERIESLIEVLVSEGVVLTSTLAIVETHFPHRPQADARTLLLLAPEWKARYHARQTGLERERSTSPMTPALFERLLAFERRFVAAGGHLVLGPDFGRHVLPGYGNQRGFELLVETGFSIPRAVRIATFDGARALGMEDRIGRILPGLDADLVVLDGDLARDAGVIRRVETVFRSGVAFAPEDLTRDLAGQVGPRAR